MSESTEQIEEQPSYQTIAEFLEAVPPNQLTHVADLSERRFLSRAGGTFDVLRTPEIQLHCANDACNGTRFFRCTAGGDSTLKTDYRYVYVTYRCWNCQQTQKTFSLACET